MSNVTPEPIGVLAQLDKADEELGEAPSLEVEIHCKEKLPTNDVVPRVAVALSPGYFHANQHVPAQVTLSILESYPELAYQGTGRPTRLGGVVAVVCSNSACTSVFAHALTAEALRGGVTAWIKPGAVGDATITLTITDLNQPRVNVVTTHSAGVSFLPVNVVTPIVTRAEPDGGFSAQLSKPAKVTLRITESTGAPAYGGTGTATIASGSGVLFEDEACTTALVGPIAAARLAGAGMPAYVLGGAVGAVTVKLTLTNPNNPAIRVIPDASGVVHIQPINVITPLVEVDGKEPKGYFHASQNKPVKVVLRLTESGRAPQYRGKGAATIAAGSAKLYDANNKKELAATLSAEALRGKGTTAFVRGEDVGKVTIRLALEPTDERFILVLPEATGPTEFLPVNVVTPRVEIEKDEAYYFNEDHQIAAPVTLRIAEALGTPAYAGAGGTVSFPGGSATLWGNPECTTRIKMPIAPARLRGEGLTAYIKPSEVGKLTAKLALAPSGDARVLVEDPATDAVDFLDPPEVITPVIGGDDLVLFYTAFPHLDATSLSAVNISFTESKRGISPRDLAAEVTFGGEITCSLDAAQKKPFDGSEPLGKPFALHLRGAAPGTCTITAKATGTTDPKVRFATAQKEILVEKLRLDAHRYRDGGTVTGSATVFANKMPKTRELHQTDGTRFTFARFVMRKPTDGFWAKATRINLAAAGKVAIFSNSAATSPLAQLVKSSFDDGDVEFWVKTTGRDVVDPDPPPDAIDWESWDELTPEKDATVAYVSCGAHATTTNKPLLRGDLLKLDTYSFDRFLDRNVRNECGRRVQPAPAASKLDVDVALAKASAHKFYDKTSAFHVNRCLTTDAKNPFGRFIELIAECGDAGEASSEGAEFVRKHLSTRGVALHVTTQDAIEAYILRTLNSGGWVYGKNWDEAFKPKVPWPFHFGLLYGVPGTHAEVLAANELLNANVPVSEMTIATYMLQKQDERQGKPFVACPNCSGILRDFRVITG